MPKYLKREGIQLCYPWEERRLEKSGFPADFFIQPKLRGERCWVSWMGEREPVLISSYGNEFKFLEHITEELKGLPKAEYDGELYRHGWSQEDVNSAANRKVNKNKDSGELEYHIFDVKSEQNQMDRFLYLKKIEKEYFGKLSSIKFVPTFVTSYSDWLEQSAEFIEEGYEGSVLRHPGWSYVEKRSLGVVKFKPTETDQYVIIGAEEEISIYGEPKNTLGSFRVMGLTEENPVIFYVGTGPALTKEKRKALWEMRSQLPGKRLIVKHEKIRTAGGIPVATVALEII